VSLEALLRGRLTEEDLRDARIPLRSGVDPAPDEISPSAPARKLPLRFCLEIVRDVALALDHAHSRGVVHRDIKPGNILVDRQGKPWLIDFGLARIARLGDPAYERGIVVGTPFYMPPEQAAGDMEQVDAFSDIYSLGAVLYELVSGLYPFTGRSEETVFDLVKVQAPLPVENLASDAPAEVLSVIRRAMARAKSDRYPTARAFADAVEECLIHVPSGMGA